MGPKTGTKSKKGKSQPATPKVRKDKVETPQSNNTQALVSDFVTSTPRRSKRQQNQQDKGASLNATYIKGSLFSSVPDLSTLSIGNQENSTINGSKFYSMDNLPAQVEDQLNIQLRNGKATTATDSHANNTQGNISVTSEASQGVLGAKTDYVTMCDDTAYVNNVLTTQACRASAVTTTSSAPTVMSQASKLPHIYPQQTPQVSIASHMAPTFMTPQQDATSKDPRIPSQDYINTSHEDTPHLMSKGLQRELFPRSNFNFISGPLHSRMVVPEIYNPSVVNYQIRGPPIRQAVPSTQRGYGMQSDLETLKFLQKEDRGVMVAMHNQLLQNSRQIKTLSSLVIRMEDELRIKKEKEDALNAKQWKAFMKLKGLDEQKHPDPGAALETFFREKLLIEGEVTLTKCYWQGKWIMFALRDISDKKRIYKNVKHLKGLKAEQGTKFQIEDQLPEERKEHRQREKQIKYINKLQPDGQRADIGFKKGQLLVNQVPHERVIKVINARVLLSLEPEDYKRLETAHIGYIGSREEEDSRFKCYAAEVMNLDQVVDNYRHLKIKYGDATHVTMAYRLPGENVAELQDYFDDGDYGIGRTILNVLIDERKFYRAIYIVRYFGKKQLGPKRFEVAQSLSLQASRAIDSSETIGAISSLHYPKSLLPPSYCLPVDSIIDSSRSIVSGSEVGVSGEDEDSEVFLNTQSMQRRLDRLRNEPCVLTNSTTNPDPQDWANMAEGQMDSTLIEHGQSYQKL